MFGKLEMEIILNATLAGGVAIGSSADFIKHPAIAMAIVISNIDCNGILDFKVIKLKDALFHSNIPLDQYVN